MTNPLEDERYWERLRDALHAAGPWRWTIVRERTWTGKKEARPVRLHSNQARYNFTLDPSTPLENGRMSFCLYATGGLTGSITSYIEVEADGSISTLSSVIIYKALEEQLAKEVEHVLVESAKRSR